MLEWSDEALVIDVRPYGEKHALVQLFTSQRGRHAGLLPYASKSHSMRAVLQKGYLVQALWNARLSEQLGTFKLEPLTPFPAFFLGRRLFLEALFTLCAFLLSCPERQNYTALYDETLKWLQTWTSIKDSSVFWQTYVHWEMNFLKHIGFETTTLNARAPLSRNTKEGWRHTTPRNQKELDVSLVTGDQKMSIEDMISKLTLAGERLEFEFEGSFAGHKLLAQRKRILKLFKPLQINAS